MDDLLVAGAERERRRLPRPLVSVVACAVLAVAIVAVRRTERTAAPPPSAREPATAPALPPALADDARVGPVFLLPDLQLVVGTSRPSLVQVTSAEVQPVPYLDMRDTRGRRLALSQIVTHAGAAWLVRSVADGEARDGDVYALRVDEAGANLVPRRVATGNGVFPAVGEDFVWVTERGRQGVAAPTVTGVGRTGRVIRAPRLLPPGATIEGSLRGGLLLRVRLPGDGRPRWWLWDQESTRVDVVLPGDASVLSTAESTIAWTRADGCTPKRCQVFLTDLRAAPASAVSLPRNHVVSRAQLSPDASYVALALTELDRSRTIAFTRMMVVATRTGVAQTVADTRVPGARGVFTTWSDAGTLVVGSCTPAGCRFGLWLPGRGLQLVPAVAPDGVQMSVVP